jgi:hypothetical protein
MKPTTITYTCPHCERVTTVTVHPYVPARVWGRPEHCHPAEGGDIEPDSCECGQRIPVDAVHAQASDQEADALAARADEVADRRRDEGR